MENEFGNCDDDERSESDEEASNADDDENGECQETTTDSDTSNWSAPRMPSHDEDCDVVDCLQPDEPVEEDDNDDAYCHVPAPIYVTPNGVQILQQHIHYAHRSPELADWTLYEYCAGITQRPWKERKQRGELDIPDQASDESLMDANDVTIADDNHLTAAGTVGRPTNAAFQFTKLHPLHTSYRDHLNSKTNVPIPIKRPPAPPPPRPRRLSLRWKERARKFALYMLVLHRPWTFDDLKNPAHFCWATFCHYMKELEFGRDGEGPTLMNTVRRRWIENATQVNKLPTSHQKINQMYRRRCATKWRNEDYSSPLQPMPLKATGCFTGDGSPSSATDDLERDAAANIDLLRQEAAMDDPSRSRAFKQQQYNRNTITFLQQLSTALQQRKSSTFMTVDRACQLINLYPEKSVDHATVLEKIKEEYEEIETESPILPSEQLSYVQRSLSQFKNRNEFLFVPETEEENMLNPDQKKVVIMCVKYLNACVVYGTGSSNKPKPLRKLIHGGPGTGKSFLVRCVHRRARQLGFNDACIAMTGVASNQLPNGHTCHTALAINPTTSVNRFPAKLTATQLEKTRRRLRHDQLRIIFIDEASHVNSETLAIIDQRLCEITGYDEPFGGLAVILMGDFFQLPPVIPPVPLFQSAMRFFVHETGQLSTRATSETAMRGAQLFITFEKSNSRNNNDQSTIDNTPKCCRR